MKEFNYKIKELPLEYNGDHDSDDITYLLSAEGELGWELVSVVPHPKRKGFGLFYMKKEKSD